MTLADRILANQCGATLLQRKCRKPKGHDGAHKDGDMAWQPWDRNPRFPARDLTWQA